MNMAEYAAEVQAEKFRAAELARQQENDARIAREAKAAALRASLQRKQ